ncbi:hypothetical protein TSAR_007287 [Trichomalopsis sarcophagae]|uniref:F-box domain-containing protein n=1 Tax=Trichomalopsis sarcophagae TaxID=543379 RepID=A0A232ER44_9HYME|nr:hypothetical protein TSAR_007287 [Trichomalopsis sarcophagae]
MDGVVVKFSKFITSDRRIIRVSNTRHSKISIHFLNDDCLIHVFQFLPIADRIRVERVCRRWQRVSKESWFDRKSLNVYTDKSGLSSSSNELLLRSPRALCEILKHCGSYLKKLEFVGYVDELIDIGARIGSLCPNLQYLELAGVTRIVLKNIAENCTDIRSFSLRDTFDSCEDELSLLFARNKRLETLEFICDARTNDGKFWLRIPTESIQTLYILNSSLSTSYFNEAVRKMKNLSKLTFDFCEDFDDESMEAICSVASLTEIQTGVYLGHIESLRPIVNLKNLKVAEFSLSDYVDDEFLIQLCQNCSQLTDVDISGCKVTDAGVASVTLLPKIERLTLNFLRITAKAFNVMPKLKAIECFKCKRISTRCFSHMIETSEDLELLNVCYCKVYNSTVKRAIIATKKRANNMTLRILEMSAAKKEDVVEADRTGINTLNDDCLMHVIQFLPIVDRVRIERVCKRWLAISLDSWRSFKILNFESECWGFNNPETLTKLNRRIFKKVLNRCGNFLTSIEFTDSTDRLGPNILNSVASFCPNIQHLDASDLEVSPWSLRVISEKCNKLVYFAVGNCTDDCDYELSLIFESNRELKRLCVYSNFEVTGSCLKKLNGDTIESIIFENCPSISLEHFNVVRGFCKLKQLVLEHFHDSNTDTMKDISSCCSNLKYLTLALCPFYLNSLQCIANLTNLKILDLSSNVSVDDELLVLVGANCKLLKQVDISYCNAVTNTGLASIVSLPNLESLFVEDLNNVDDEVFRAMPTLRQMDCSYCSNMRDAGLVRLIEASENMEHLFLSNCKKISNDLLEAAIRATKKRTNQVVLKLHLSNTDVRLSKASGTSPFLRVVPMIVITHVGKVEMNAEQKEMGINALNDDCLMHIIQYLPIVDRVRIERVCKRWLAISLNSWYNFNSLNFENKCWGFRNPVTLTKVNRRIFKKVLNRCGKFLISVEFLDSNGRLGPHILKSVASFCPNVQYLDASDLEVSPCSLRALAKKCHKLVFFAVGNCTDKCDCELSSLFANNRELKRLCVQSNFEVTGECLKGLNSHSIESIIFTSCPWITMDNFHVVRGYRNLKQLVLEDYLDFYEDIMKDISLCSKSLRYLSLSVGDSYMNSLIHISKLRNLHSLDLSSNLSVENELLVSIGANCKLLKQVDISYCNAVTNTGLASIVSLPKLESLFVESLNNIDDEVFHAMPALRQMDCSFCVNLRDAGLVRLIEASENVEHLYLNRCENVSNELLEAAIRATKKRENEVVLKMHLSNTNVRLDKASDTSPFLRVVPMIIVTDEFGLSESVSAPHTKWDFYLL